MTDETIRSTNVRGLKTHEEIFETFDKSVFSPARKAPLSARRTFYYDARNRVIQSVETTPLGYGWRISYKYDYLGNILIRDEQHNISEGEPLNLRYAYTYDGRGRQLREVVSINGKVCADVASAYDELGRLQTKTAGNGLETEHKYNIQGWLSGITHSIKAPSVNLQTGDTSGFATLFSPNNSIISHRRPPSPCIREISRKYPGTGDMTSWGITPMLIRTTCWGA